MAARFVLPDLVANGEIALRRAFEAGHGAQAGRLARAGVAEQGADAAARQAEIDVEHEVLAVDMKTGGDFAAHRAFLRAGLKVYRPSRTTKLNSTMPPASQCAWVYSIASTWS